MHCYFFLDTNPKAKFIFFFLKNDYLFLQLLVIQSVYLALDPLRCVLVNMEISPSEFILSFVQTSFISCISTKNRKPRCVKNDTKPSSNQSNNNLMHLIQILHNHQMWYKVKPKLKFSHFDIFWPGNMPIHRYRDRYS